jgi:multidrug efflux pump subunit AcrA (membrane-fusion protein)
MLRARLPDLLRWSLCLAGAALVMAPIVACQIVAPEPSRSSQPLPEPRRILNRAAPGTPGAAGSSDLTTSVKRGTLVDGLSLSGNAFPLRTAQLGFQTNGSIAALPVRSGQIVREGDRVAELAVDLGGSSAIVPLTAPFDALVTGVEASVGQSVTPQNTIVRLADTSRYYVTANASEYDVLRLQPDQRVEVSFPAVSNAPVNGVIVDVGQIGSVQGERVQFPIRIDLNAAPERLRPGMTARINVALRRAEDALYVPSGALRRAGGETTVTRVGSDGRVGDVPIEIGDTFGNDVEVLDGLSEGDVVVVYSPSAATTR